MGNRVIKFRGKRIDNGEWVVGDLIHRKIWRSKIFAIRIYDDGFDIYEEHEVIPETVGQYTGLKDKNGKEIYEGDIITTDLERPYLIVEYRNGAFMINCNDGSDDYYDIFFRTSEEPQEVWKYGEVIGNIHDNPELMEVE